MSGPQWLCGNGNGIEEDMKYVIIVVLCCSEYFFLENFEELSKESVMSHKDYPPYYLTV